MAMMVAAELEQATVLTTQSLILSTAFQGWIRLLPLVLGDVIEACHLSN